MINSLTSAHMRSVQEKMVWRMYEMCNDVIDGNEMALPLYHMIRNMRSALDDIEKAIKPTLMNEINSPEGFDYDGVNYKIRSGSGRHSYDHIAEWKSLNLQIKDIEKKAQLAYKMQLSGDQYVSNDGELIPPSVYVSYDDAVVATKLKKGH